MIDNCEPKKAQSEFGKGASSSKAEIKVQFGNGHTVVVIKSEVWYIIL